MFQILLIFLGIYAYNGVDRSAQYFNVLQYFPIVGFITIHFLNNFGLSGIPGLMMGEVFSFRSSLASGLTIAFMAASIFISTKTFYLIEAVFTFPGQWIFYGCLGLVQ